MINNRDSMRKLVVTCSSFALAVILIFPAMVQAGQGGSQKPNSPTGAKGGSQANQRPVCVLPPNQTAACQGGTTVFLLDGSGSYDPDGDPLTYKWTACSQTTLTAPDEAMTLALVDSSSSCSLTCAIRLRVEDPSGAKDFCRTYVSVQPAQCEAPSTNCSNFNGTAVNAGDFIWFNGVVKVTGAASCPFTAFVSGATITFDANGTSYVLDVPDNEITFSATATSASTVYDALLDRWVTTVPCSYSGNVFLTGLSFPVPVDLPGGINPVCFDAQFSSEVSGLSFQWKWSAAVYDNFSADHTALGVKPIDGSSANPYANSDKAGTPENFKAFAIGGARGGGSSNFTGSYSGTKSVGCP